MPDRLFINRLKIPTIIGIHQPERSKKQDLFITVELRLDLRQVCESDDIFTTADYGKIADLIIAYVSESRRFTIETLADDIARICFDEARLEEVSVLIEKPYAHHAAESMAVKISRVESDLSRQSVVIGLGSNQNAEVHLPRAVKELKSIGTLSKVSNAYQFDDASGRSPGKFVNAAIMLDTLLPPMEVRRRLKQIELQLGRVESSDVIPVDLDLCLFGNLVIDEGPLRLPPAQLLQDGYLASTVAELASGLIHPETGETIQVIAARLSNSTQPVNQEAISNLLRQAITTADDDCGSNPC